MLLLWGKEPGCIPLTVAIRLQGNGTSFSSPVMAGAVACLWQAWPQKGNMDIIRVVKRSASQFSNPDTLLGYGIPNFSLANSA